MYGARFRQEFTLEDAIGSHACSLQASMRVTNGIPLGSVTLLPVDTVTCVAPLKAASFPERGFGVAGWPVAPVTDGVNAANGFQHFRIIQTGENTEGRSTCSFCARRRALLVCSREVWLRAHAYSIRSTQPHLTQHRCRKLC